MAGFHYDECLPAACAAQIPPRESPGGFCRTLGRQIAEAFTVATSTSYRVMPQVIAGNPLLLFNTFDERLGMYAS
jgi:hypothetical protein